MILSNVDELWRKITPEAKINALNKSHSSGVFAALISVIIAGTVAIGLKINFIFWCILLLTPITFQFFSSRSWRNIKPSLILQYLAVRSVVRRFAFIAQAKNLEPEIIFEGTATVEPANPIDIEEVTEMIHNHEEFPVWIALFLDTIVIFKEALGGGQLIYSSPINEHLIFECSNLDNENSTTSEYSTNKEIKLQYTDKREITNIIRLRSAQPASLIIFERKLRFILNPPKISLATEVPDSIKK